MNLFECILRISGVTGGIQKRLIGILVASMFFSCEERKPSKPVTRNQELNINDQELDSIVEMIDLHECLKRENYGRWIYSEKRLKQLKDSINYDSIVFNRALKIKLNE